MTETPADVMIVARQAAKYREWGWNPLPSRNIAGRVRPSLKSYSHLRDHGIGESILRNWWGTHVQVATGSRWGLAVVDLDGPMAIDVWRLWTMHREPHRTWAVQHDPNGGMHLWFTIPKDEPLPFKTGIWWLGESLEKSNHNCIEILGDGNLIVAPPSVSPRTGRPYQFLPGRGPDDIERPAPLPTWVRSLVTKQVEESRRDSSSVGSVLAPVPDMIRRGGRLAPRLHLSWEDVRAAIPDKVALVRSWGVRVVGDKPSPRGWIVTRSIFREDNHPSAAVNLLGDYWEPLYGSHCLSIFQLAVVLGLYPSFTEAVDGIGYDHGVTRSTWQPQQRTA
jgi:hypothetical protein